MKSLYALLVGVNEYKAPIKTLRGCVSDVEKIQKFIKQQYAETMSLNIKTLLNEDATYDNVHDAFENHLAQASENDVIWFHFSGHGSEEKSADEFLAFDSTGKDQTLLCVDSIPGEKPHLADKELAVLLHYVSTKFPDQRPKEKPPHILVSLDCCHSGSATRSIRSDDKYVGVRNAVSSGAIRSLDSYANGFYSNQNPEELIIPSSPHIAISACDRHQKAGDLNGGGAFSTGLVKALHDSNGKINYPDLFLRTRSAVRRIRKNQSPKFSFISGFNPYSQFLNGASMGVPDEFEVTFEDGNWFLKCGAIHGLPTHFDKDISVEILTAAPDSDKIGDATIVSVGAQRSELKMDLEFSLKSTWNSLVKPDTDYRGIMRNFPLPKEFIFIQGESQAESDFIQKWESDKNIALSTDESLSQNLKIVIADRYQLIDLNRDETITNTTDLHEFIDSIDKVVKWYRFLALRNPNPKSVIEQGMELSVEVRDAEDNHLVCTESSLVLKANAKNSRDGAFGFMPKIKIQKINQDLFFYLFYLKPDYAIVCPEEETLFDGDSDGDGVTDRDERIGPDAISDSGDETNPNDPTDFHESQITLMPRNASQDLQTLDLNLWKEFKGLGPNENESVLECHFKLLVTSEELDYFQFIQTGLGKRRSNGNADTVSTSKFSEEWAVFDFHLRIERE